MKDKLLFSGGLCALGEYAYCIHYIKYSKSKEPTVVAERINGDGVFEIPLKKLHHLNVNQKTIPLIGGKKIKEAMIDEHQVAYQIFDIEDVYVKIDYFLNDWYNPEEDGELFQEIEIVKIIGYEGIEIKSLMGLQAACELISFDFEIGYYKDAAKEFKVDMLYDLGAYN